ncbi:hypothetical protein SBA2_110006 [Acidobacteriia bacterium SbA2]|nr:hypothetical protein SBA2_110006 [Acidobacteriia bacterium SbA2]
MKPPDEASHPAFGTPLPAGGERGKGVGGAVPGYSCPAPAGLSFRAVPGDPERPSVISLREGSLEPAFSSSGGIR